MTRSPICVLFVSLSLLAGCRSAAVAPPAPQRSPFRIIGYVAGSAEVSTASARKLTHINYAFAKVRGDDRVVFEDPEAPKNLARLRALKSANPELKILLSVGGWGAEWFSDAALDDDSRCRFASSAADLMIAHELDGLDLDWEYPGQPGAGNRHRAEDKQNFTRLLEAVRQELDIRGAGRERYLLTIATGGGRYFNHTEMDRVHGLLDWINVMTYDLSGGWLPITAHHTPLYATRGPSTAAYVDQHLHAGIPANKIVIGAAFYGKLWRWANRTEAGLGEPYDLYAADISYARVVRDFESAAGFEKRWDAAARAPYLWQRELGTFVSYEDPQSIREKARFVRERGLGGVMYWQHGHDLSETLLTALRDALTSPTAAAPR